MLPEIAKDLQEHENSTRIKKLIFCACTKRWENDFQVISQYSWVDLLTDLTKAYSSLEQLGKTLYKIVESLNRQSVYYPLANVIIDKLANFYSGGNDTTQPFSLPPPSYTNTTPATPSLTFEQIVQEFEQNENKTRIQKILFCACENHWESDINVLNSIPLNDLLVRLLQRNITQEQLAHSLYQVVQSLNRQAEYFLVANYIITKLLDLYAFPDGTTRIVSSKTPVNQETIVADGNEEGNNSQAESQKRKPDYNPFDLRLELMKYTNPLRAKVIIFSLLYHPFNYSSQQDWSLLKTYELDDLLIKLYYHYSTLEELQEDLTDMAENLDQPYENTQAAGGIYQCIQQLYNQA